MKKLILFSICLFLAGPCQARIIYVDANTPDNNDGSSWAHAYKYLQDALADANSAPKPVEVWVAAGTYTPDTNSAEPNGTGEPQVTFHLINGVAIYGGFPSGGGDWESRDPEAHETILSADLNNDDALISGVDELLVDPNRTDNSYHLVTGSQTDPNAVIDGLTIKSGNAKNSAANKNGGGMYNLQGSPTIKNCIFAENLATFGGGVCDSNSSPTLINCIFTKNAGSDRAGGMRNIDGSSPTLINCTFNENESGLHGGGAMENDISSPTLINCILSHNVSIVGGAIYNWGTDLTLTNCTFTANLGRPGNGGAIYCLYGNLTASNCVFNGNSTELGLTNSGAGAYLYYATATLTNCTFSGNSADDYGGGLCNRDENPTIIDCTFSNNSALSGGGIYNENSDPNISNCTISGNSATRYGGGMYNEQNSSPTVTNCAFAGNSAGWGGGMYNEENCSATLVNCTFAGNSAANGEGMCNVIESNPTVTNCILWGNTAPSGPQIYNDGTSSATVSYSDVEGGWPGTENIDEDPLFVDPNGPDGIAGTEDDNLRLSGDSDCIDAGDNNSVPADTADLDGDGNTVEPTPLDLNGFPRFIDDLCTVDTGNPAEAVAIVDMGAYEFLRSDINSNGSVDFEDYCVIAERWPETSCGLCGGADLTCDGDVDWNDLRELVAYWLAGAGP